MFLFNIHYNILLYSKTHLYICFTSTYRVIYGGLQIKNRRTELSSVIHSGVKKRSKIMIPEMITEFDEKCSQCTCNNYY